MCAAADVITNSRYPILNSVRECELRWLRFHKGSCCGSKQTRSELFVSILNAAFRSDPANKSRKIRMASTFASFTACFSSCRACEALCQCLPDQLKDETFTVCLKEDKSTKHWLTQLLKNLEQMGSQSGGSASNSNAASLTAAGAAQQQKNAGMSNIKLPGGI